MAAVVGDDDGHGPAVGLRFGTGGGEDGGDFGLAQYGFAFHLDSPVLVFRLFAGRPDWATEP